MKPAHLRAQAALVRMIYDPGFAAAVKAAPRAVLAGLPAALADELGAVDPRALRRDVDWRERTLGLLCEELPAATTLALAERREVALLLGFYASAAFHEAVEEDRPWVLALGAYLEERLAEGVLTWPATAAVLALELASARARRAGAEPALHTGSRERLRCARGVEPVEVPAGALAALQAAARHRFRLALLPAWALAIDPPPLPPPQVGPAREHLCAIAVRGEVSLVQLERPLHAVLVSASVPRSRAAIADEAALRIGDRAAVEAALEELVAGELLVATS